MNIYFNFLSNHFNFISNHFFAASLKQRVAIIATAILGCTTLYYLCCYRFKAEKLDLERKDSPVIKEEEQKLEELEKVERIVKQAVPPLIAKKDKEKKPKAPKAEKNIERLSGDISFGKVKALETYKNQPNRCGKIQKSIIFRDIKFIESTVKDQQDVVSVVGLMLYLSELSEVDLNDPVCAHVIIDVFKECNKETTEQLAEWLSKQETFNTNLLQSCFEVFIDKHQQQLPFNPYVIELLMKIYQEKKCNQDESKLPSNHPSVISAMAILIKCCPNEDRIIALTEWMMSQKEYDLTAFAAWISVFQQKETETKAINFYYPLLDKMIADFKTKWGVQHMKNLKASVAIYLVKKDPALID